MKIIPISIILLGICFKGLAQNAVPSAEVQIQTAVLAAPLDKREHASVYGYNEKGEFILLRKGSNEMICLADDPKVPGLNVASYHQALEPFMKRGRDLKKAGKTPKEIRDIRDEESNTGKLNMPKQSSSLYVYTAKAEDFIPETGVVKNGYLRYVIYIPYATSETTGLPLKPDAEGMPWIMDPGTPRAHIMISPPKKN